MMDWQFFLGQLKEVIRPLDTLSILVTFFITQSVKSVVAKQFRPLAAIGVGVVVSLSWALYQETYTQILAYGFVYGAGAIALYMVGLEKFLRSFSAGNKLMGGK